MKLLKFTIVLIGMLATTILGYRIGFNKATDYFLRQVMSSNLTNLTSYIKVAELLKTNQKEKSEELLEKFIDVQLSYLGPQVNQKAFKPVRQEIIQSIKEAKEYRIKWTSSTHQVNANLKRGVDAAFSADNVQPGGGTQPAR